MPRRTPSLKTVHGISQASFSREIEDFSTDTTSGHSAQQSNIVDLLSSLFSFSFRGLETQSGQHTLSLCISHPFPVCWQPSTLHAMSVVTLSLLLFKVSRRP